MACSIPYSRDHLLVSDEALQNERREKRIVDNECDSAHYISFHFIRGIDFEEEKPQRRRTHTHTHTHTHVVQSHLLIRNSGWSFQDTDGVFVQPSELYGFHQSLRPALSLKTTHHLVQHHDRCDFPSDSLKVRRRGGIGVV